MNITRDQIVRRLAEESNYYQRDIRILFQYLDDIVLDYFNQVTEEEDINLQLVTGIKVGCKVMGERTRKDPRTQDDIICKPTVKPKAVFSQDFRAKIQKQYDSKNDG